MKGAEKVTNDKKCYSIANAKKWNYKTNQYDDYLLPDGAALTAPMSAVVECASCGKMMIFGEAYTSLEIHTKVGMGFAVCDRCHEHEIKRKIKYERT